MKDKLDKKKKRSSTHPDFIFHLGGELLSLKRTVQRLDLVAVQKCLYCAFINLPSEKPESPALAPK